MKFYIRLYVYSLKYCFDLKAFPCRGSLLDLNFDNLFNFFYIPMLPLTLFFIYRHDLVLVVAKNDYSVKYSFSF